MRALNEPIARMANAEDQCTGRFWEGRFSSQALLDEPALAACMAYVDLNPIRANIARTPEDSEHTSIKRRIDCARRHRMQPKSLFPFVGNPREPMPEGLPFRLQEYLELVDWTARILREEKRGFIDACQPPILERLHFDSATWLTLASRFESKVKVFVGAPERVRNASALLGYQRAPGVAACRSLFS